MSSLKPRSSPRRARANPNRDHRSAPIGLGRSVDAVPGSHGERDGKKRHQAAPFDAPYLIDPDELGTRIACLEPLGINLPLQRWVHHNSRVVVEIHLYNEVTAGPFEGADITEDWCEDRNGDGLSPSEATAECLAWLPEPAQPGGPLR